MKECELNLIDFLKALSTDDLCWCDDDVVRWINEFEKLREQLNTIGAKCGGQGNKIAKLELALQKIIDREISCQRGQDGIYASINIAYKALKGEK